MLYSYQKMGETYGTTSKDSNPVHNKNPRNEKSTLDNLNKEKIQEIDPNVQTKTAAANDKGTISNKQTDGVNKNETNIVTKKVSHTLHTEESNHDSQNNVDNAAFETIVNDEVNIEVESMATEEVNFPQELSTPRNLKRNEDKKFLPGKYFSFFYLLVF